MPSIVLQTLAVLRVDGVDLSGRGVLTEGRSDEEPRQSIESLFKPIIRALKVVVGVCQRCESIVIPSVVLDEL